MVTMKRRVERGEWGSGGSNHLFSLEAQFAATLLEQIDADDEKLLVVSGFRRRLFDASREGRLTELQRVKNHRRSARHE